MNNLAFNKVLTGMGSAAIALGGVLMAVAAYQFFSHSSQVFFEHPMARQGMNCVNSGVVVLLIAMALKPGKTGNS